MQQNDMQLKAMESEISNPKHEILLSCLKGSLKWRSGSFYPLPNDIERFRNEIRIETHKLFDGISPSFGDSAEPG